MCVCVRVCVCVLESVKAAACEKQKLLKIEPQQKMVSHTNMCTHPRNAVFLVYDMA